MIAVVPQAAQIVVQDIAISRRHTVIADHARLHSDHVVQVALVVNMIGQFALELV
jgi:hypothetical protein